MIVCRLRSCRHEHLMSKLTLLHFNDVYKVGPQKLDPKSSDTIDVTQFTQQLIDIRDKKRAESDVACLTLFSGDLLSPSVESSVTRGSHMVWFHSLWYAM